jgi:hypothetical protein
MNGSGLARLNAVGTQGENGLKFTTAAVLKPSEFDNLFI